MATHPNSWIKNKRHKNPDERSKSENEWLFNKAISTDSRQNQWLRPKTTHKPLPDRPDAPGLICSKTESDNAGQFWKQKRSYYEVAAVSTNRRFAWIYSQIALSLRWIRLRFYRFLPIFPSKLVVIAALSQGQGSKHEWKIQNRRASILRLPHTIFSGWQRDNAGGVLRCLHPAAKATVANINSPNRYHRKNKVESIRGHLNGAGTHLVTSLCKRWAHTDLERKR